MSPTPPIGSRGTVPEATSALVFALVAGLLWYALLRTGAEVGTAEAAADPASRPGIRSVDPAPPPAATTAPRVSPHVRDGHP